MILEKHNIRDLIWVNGAWDKETKSFMYSREINLAGFNSTGIEANYSMFNNNFLRMQDKAILNGYAQLSVDRENKSTFALTGSSTNKKALTICRVLPAVTRGIQTLNLLLDPNKSSQRSKTVMNSMRKYHDDFEHLDLEKSYEKLFELLWYTRLPCFDVKGITSKVRDEMSVIKRCFWRGKMVDCASVFVTRSTDRGMCCTFNLDDAENIFEQNDYRRIATRMRKRDRELSFKINETLATR